MKIIGMMSQFSKIGHQNISMAINAYCGAKLKPIDEITLFCNTCNRFWFFNHLQEKGTEDW